VQRRKTKWTLPLTLILLTFGTTFYVGATMVLAKQPGSLSELIEGWVFSVPLMSILLAHEFGHFFAGKYHRVDVSPPYFIPLPLLGLGTLGAVIQIRERIRSRNALLDIGAAGPLAGMAVALPVLIYGLATSPVEPIPDGTYLLEGRSLLYLGLLFGLKGPIPEGYDIMLNPTAFAGWAGLLVTMINLIPFGQLDGGHVAYAMLGPRQDRVSRYVLRALPVLAVVVGAAYAIPSYLDGIRGEQLSSDAGAGFYWFFWALLLWFLTRATGPGHPPTDDDRLSPRRRVVGALTLVLFALLFMPAWLRVQ
jgi:membrane-associated protease RseP (regulator of RpoE activity)